MPSLTSVKAGGVIGLVFVVITVIGMFLAPAPPGADEASAEFLEYLTDNRTALMVQSSITNFAGIPLVLFAVLLGKWLGGPGSKSDVFSRAATLSWIAAWAAVAPLGIMYGGLAYVSKTSLDADLARTLALVLTSGFVTGILLMGLAAAATGAVLITKQGLLRILGWLGFVVLALAVLSSFPWADDGALSLGPSLFFGYIGALVFVLLTSIAMLRSSDA
jgi:hypothetical protein